MEDLILLPRRPMHRKESTELGIIRTQASDANWKI